jgi:hypothetical protein
VHVSSQGHLCLNGFNFYSKNSTVLDIDTDAPEYRLNKHVLSISIDWWGLGHFVHDLLTARVCMVCMVQRHSACSD